jgi:hypothetical protein
VQRFKKCMLIPRKKNSEKFGGNSGKRVRKNMLSSGEHLPNFSEFSLEFFYGCRQSSGLIMKFYYDINICSQNRPRIIFTKSLLVFFTFLIYEIWESIGFTSGKSKKKIRYRPDGRINRVRFDDRFPPDFSL